MPQFFDWSTGNLIVNATTTTGSPGSAELSGFHNSVPVVSNPPHQQTPFYVPNPAVFRHRNPEIRQTNTALPSSDEFRRYEQQLIRQYHEAQQANKFSHESQESLNFGGVVVDDGPLVFELLIS